jgi:hypothetical protein
VAQRDRRQHDDRGTLAELHLSHERAIDLDRGDGQANKALQSRVADPEVVEGDRDALRRETPERLTGIARVFQCSLGYLDFDQVRGDLRAGQQALDLVDEAGVFE